MKTSWYAKILTGLSIGLILIPLLGSNAQPVLAASSANSISYIAIAAGDNHTCGLTESGGVECWGWDLYGQLGNGMNTNSNIPVNVIGLNTGVIAIAAGYEHTCALVSSGGVKCWGLNNSGQLGNNSTTNKNMPVDVVNGNGLLSGIKAITAGAMFTCALTLVGGVICWGNNDSGQLGNGTNTGSLLPVNVVGLTNGISAIAAGNSYICGIMGSGVKCWGSNYKGELGDGTTVEKNVPIDVKDGGGFLSGVSAIAAGQYHSCALSISGGIKCWGLNNQGQLGDRSNIDRTMPVDVVNGSGLLSGVSALKASGWHSCALLKNNGGIMCWGDNQAGALGNNTTNNSNTPVNVSGFTSNVLSISAGIFHTCALTTMYGVKCWGYNAYGQLGDGTYTNQLTPVDVVGSGAPYSISGVIKDDLSNPKTGVLVTLSDGQKTTTDNDGGYLFPISDQSNYTIIPSLSGYRFAPGQATIDLTKASTQDFIVRPDPPVPFLDLPFKYTTLPGYSLQQTFSILARGNIDKTGKYGRVNTWFDHEYPTYTSAPNAGTNNILLWNGRLFDFNHVTSQQGISWYDGHDGIDFAMPEGEDVLAAADGDVDADNTGWGCLGYQVTINHNNGYFSVYGHLRDRPTISGYVTQGEIIGVSGNTVDNSKGCSTSGPHLHFGIYYDVNGNGKKDSLDKPVDPFGWNPVNDPGKTDPWSVSVVSDYLWQYSNVFPFTLTSSGATQKSPTGMLTMQIPAGAVSSDVTLEILDTPPVADASANLRLTGQGFLTQIPEWIIGSSTFKTNSKQNLSATNFAQPVNMTVNYDPDQLMHLDLTNLALYQWDDLADIWTALASTIDSVNHTVTAQTTNVGNFSLQAPLVCPADTLEPNDNYDGASYIQTDGTSVSNLFDIATDEDWFKFDATAGTSYEIQTTNLATGVDTVLEIYDTNGVTMLATNDNSGGGNASLLTWQAPADGTYFVRVRQAAGSAYGCDASYDVATRIMHRIYLPLVER